MRTSTNKPFAANTPFLSAALARAVGAAVALLAIAGATACGGAGSSDSDPVDDSELASTTATTPAPPSGLMMRGGVPPTSEESYVTSSVAMLHWKDIQPSGPDDWDWSSLDHALGGLANAGVTHVRVRIMSGGDAPAWVRRLGAPDAAHPWFQGVMPKTTVDCSPTGGTDYGGVAVQNIQGPTACVPFFWTTAYLNAYESLMTHLRAQLDSSPQKYAIVSSIVDSACMAVYAEVFYRGQGVPETNENLWNAGLTHDRDIACQKTAITIHKNAFGATRRTAVAINNWDVVQGTPGPRGDYRTTVWQDATVWGTYEFAEWARAQLNFGNGSILEVQNNGLHTSSECVAGGTPTTSYFCFIAQYPRRHGFQTQSYQPSPLSPSGASLTLLQDLDNGLKMNAQYIELPGGMTAADWRLMGCYNQHLLNGDPSPCPH